MAVDSIWNNNFYDTPPVPTWLFELDFTECILNESKKSYYASMLAKAAVSCTWPERNITSIPVYYAGVESKLPGRVANSGELEIKFNENYIYEISKILEELFRADSMDDAYFNDTGSYSINKYFSKNRMIRLILFMSGRKKYITNPYNYNDDIKRPVVIEFHNCWLSKIGSQEFSYENEEETVTRTATFTYDYFKINHTLIDNNKEL